MLNKKGGQDPWNTVRQDQNIKVRTARHLIYRLRRMHMLMPMRASQLYTPNRSFWTERTGLPDPRAAFLAAEHKVEDLAHKAKDKVKDKVQEIKDRGVGNRP